MRLFRFKVFFVLFAIIAFFVIVTARLRTEIILTTSIQVFRFLQTFGYAMIFLVGVYGIITMILFIHNQVATMDKYREREEKELSVQSNPLKLLESEVNTYLQENLSVPFFKDSLTSILAQIAVVSQQVESVSEIAESRFGEDSMSYTQFTLPVNNLLDHLIRLSLDLVRKLDMFDAARYQGKIDAGGQVQEYVDVMKIYEDFVRSVLASVERTTLKLDRLIVEMGKLSNDDLSKSISALQELDTVIINTKLYRD